MGVKGRAGEEVEVGNRTIYLSDRLYSHQVRSWEMERGVVAKRRGEEEEEDKKEEKEVKVKGGGGRR